MNGFWKRHWTTLLGSIFMIASLITLFKYTSDQGLLTEPVKIGIGLLSGAVFVAAGIAIYRMKRSSVGVVSELLAGLGIAIWYTTCSYAGIYAAVWNAMTVMIVMSAITIGIALFAYRFDSRLLMSVGLGGSLLAPFAMQPETDQVFTLFLYLFVVNAVFFVISVMKRWYELRIAAFLLTWIMYAVYYIHFDPEIGQLWSMPMRYAIAAFLFYLIAFYTASWQERSGYSGLNVFFGLVNTLMFGMWAATILESEFPMTILLSAVGIVYLAIAAIFYRVAGSNSPEFYIHCAAGSLSLLLGLANLGSDSMYRPMIGVFVWTFIASLGMVIGYLSRKDGVKFAATVIWICTGLYWFVKTWDVPRMNWFDQYVPFANGGAVAWMWLAAFGFFCARKIHFALYDTETNALFANLYAIVAHLVVGGLLTVQISNLFDAYPQLNGLSLTLSITWGIYALLLFIWGAYSGQSSFRWFGSAVLIITSVKAILFDMSDESAIYKMIAFIALGAISFGITWINQRWMNSGEKKLKYASNNGSNNGE